MENHNETDNNALHIPDTNKVISEAIIKMVNEPLRPLIRQLQSNSNINAVMGEAIKAINEPIKQFLKASESTNQTINMALSKSLSDTISQALKMFQAAKIKIDHSKIQTLDEETVSEEVAEKAAAIIENTANLLEENGVDSSQIPEFNEIKSKKSFTIGDIANICTIIGFLLSIILPFSQKDTTVNNYNQNITINYNNNQEKENDSSALNETDINQICDYLSTLLESLLTSQENSGKSEKYSENADSPLPDPKVANDNQETTSSSTPDHN